MAKSNKLSILIFSFLLVIASLLFVACGEKDYSNVYITSSSETVELFVGEEQNITLTINNPVSNMSGSLTHNPPQNGYFSVSVYNSSSYSTTYTITALSGGEEAFTVRTDEGGISYSVNIIVREYSTSLMPKEDALYLSLSTPYIPSASDFTFSDNATERELNFYFFGITDQRIDEEDLLQGEEFINSFESVSLAEQNSNRYLVFEDSQGLLYSLSSPETYDQSVRYHFVQVEQEDGLYNFDEVNAYNVNEGNKFTYLAVYTLSDGQLLTCQRDFYVLTDINYQTLSHDVGYRIVEYADEYTFGSDYVYKLPNSENAEITLVPSFQSTIEEGFFVGNTADFMTAYVEVTLQTQSSLLNVKASNSQNSNIINSVKLGQLSQGGYTTYYYQVNCSTSTFATTNFNLTFFYKGFENSDDPNVNFTYSIPVSIRLIPTSLLLNDIDLNNVEQVFTFYNHYAPGQSYGWQRFYLSLNPQDAEFDYIQINLTGSGLQLQYDGNTYFDQVVTIYSLDMPIYIKGSDNAPISTENEQLPITLYFNVLQEGSYQANMQYQIVQGATAIDYVDQELENQTLYLDYNAGEQEFLQLYADSYFQSISIEGDSNIVRFVLGDTPYILEGGRYILNLRVVPLAIGNASYSISLDNGIQIPISIAVEESLESVSVVTQNQQNSIRYSENISEDGRNSTLFYVYNRSGQENYFDVQVIANDNPNSSAINSIQFNTASQIITIEDSFNNNKNFNIYLRQNGSSTLELVVAGYQIENFKVSEIPLYYYIDIVAFDYIGSLNVFKESDGRGDYIDPNSPNFNTSNYGVSASYADVYSGTNNLNARTVIFNVSVNNTDAYLFAEPSRLNQDERYAFVPSFFEERFVYWETDWTGGITLNGQPTNIMYYDQDNASSNVYTLSGVGTFDTSTRTFTALANLVNPREFKLIAHVRQYGYVYSYTINVRISVYEEVDNITLQDAITSLEFTSTNRELSLIAYPTNPTATNGEIVALFEGGEIPTGVQNQTVSMLTEDSVQYIESDGRYQIILTINDEFVTYGETYTEEMVGTLRIVARDWLDENNNIYSQYSSKVIEIAVYFANGTEKNRITLTSAQDIANMNLSAHYKISSTIDLSSISDRLPLGQLSGSIVGTGEYASIIGINIINGKIEEQNSYYGLFTSIAEGGYLEYISFSGEFNIGSANNQSTYAPANSYIGLVAGVNNGSLINIGVNISSSQVNMISGQFGGVVGENNGLILQDYTLFEASSSQTRSWTPDQLSNNNSIGSGRFDYAGLMPKILAYYQDALYVNYISNYQGQSQLNTYVGGAIGYNNGVARKVDSKVLTFIGYTNYMAYSLIYANQVTFGGAINITNIAYVGGLIGASDNSSIIDSGYNLYQNSVLNYTKYLHYQGSNEADSTNDYQAGQGIVVGGEVSGYNYVGGVIGYIDEVGNNGIDLDNFTGITSRTFVRGQLASSTSGIANVAGIAYVSRAETLRNAFAMQAVDEGGAGINASMIILYNSSVVADYFSDVSGNIANSNKLAFGISRSNNADVMYGTEGEAQANKNYINVTSFVISRTKFEMEETTMNITSYNRTSYYGDFVIVGNSDSGSVLLAQSFFVEGDEQYLSLSAKYNNKMTAQNTLNYQGVGNKEVYFMFYFSASYQSSESQYHQDLLDLYMNYVNYNSLLYPFITNGEMIFTSNTPNILTIDQNGRINVKTTGLAHISASSVLNTNNALEFYIYVVNYFNPDEESFTSSSEQTSIIYPNGSANSTPLGDSTINLRGENSASLFVRPHYALQVSLPNVSGGSLTFESDSTGQATLSNVVFTLTANTVVSAQVSAVTRVEGDNIIDAREELDIDITSQTITIRRNDQTLEADYKLTITPLLNLSFVELETVGNSLVDIVYSSNVNRELDNVTVNYKKGAISITNSRYNEVPFISSKQIDETIIINSTAEEEIPYYYIANIDGENLQGSEELKQLNYAFLFDTNNEYGRDFLFNVNFEIDQNNLNNLSSQKFYLTITVNKNSPVYQNRYLENIYGQYVIYILAQSNTEVFTYFVINFEQTNILSVVVDNYTNLSETTGSSGVSSTSDYAVPGTTGLLAITVTPDDSDFDYILIENAEANYQTGNAVATFGFLARYASLNGNGEIFDDKSIIGSSTSTGIRLELNDIINTYNQEDASGNNLYYTYNGIIYIRYNMGSLNVIDGSLSNIVISLIKDNQIFTTTKQLTVQLQNYVTVELDGKTPTNTNVDGYHAHYSVARGLRYRLNIGSYGYMSSSISQPTVSNSELASIVEEDGVYYLQITSNSINYLNGGNSFDITISATQQEGDIERTSSSKTRVTVQEYVLNYNDESENLDIVVGMGEGVVNVQVGTQTTFEIDLFDYIEYDSSNIEVVNSINSFMDSLDRRGIWIAYTNLLTDSQPDYGQADQDGLQYTIGYTNDIANSGSNYYFNYNGLNITPLRTHLPNDRYYYFTYSSYIDYSSSSGTYVVSDNINATHIATEFVINVYSSSSEESPIPIYDYEDFLNMQNGYYILLNDITLPHTADEEQGIKAFTPRTANFRSLDGNGHTINFAGSYDMGSLDSIGLFTSLPNGSIIRNLNVNFTAPNDGSDVTVDDNEDYGWSDLRTVKFTTSASSFDFGGIVVDNQGIITNCSVTTDVVSGSEYYIAVRADNALTGVSYIGGICATNAGYITNCEVSANIKSPYNIGGIVGINNGKIASSSYKNGKLINNSQQNQHLAGFAVSNSSDGQIITSFVSGEQSNTSPYSTDLDSYLSSTLASAGFVYQNEGSISDCYTDINLSNTYSDMAGFAYYNGNGGIIKNSFSLSLLRNNVTASSGFARYNVLEDMRGQFINCYYFYNQEISGDNYDDLGYIDGFIEGAGNINTSVVPINYQGVQRLNAGGFANLQENFQDFSYQDEIGVNGVWFFSRGNSSTTFIDYIPTTEKVTIESNDASQTDVQTNTVYRTELKTFAYYRLELVSANIDVLSIRNFSYSEVDGTSGNVTYHYVDDSNTANRGSIHNPRLIYNASTMESEISEQTSSTGMNITNYRIISDIDYSTYDGISSLYNTTFAGVLEGNGMEISQINLVSMDNLTSAGLFAQIGYSASRTGSVKNLTISPRQVAFTNARSVGTLAGTLQYGYVYDITIDGKDETSNENVVVVGQNFTGGVVGRAINSYSLKNIISNISVSATYTSEEDSLYNESIANLSAYSYSGSVAGYIGTGEVYNVEVDGVASSLGSRAGLVFGGMGSGSYAERVFVDVLESSTIRAYHYGGYIAGEIAGSLNYAYVSDNGSTEYNFSVVPRASRAVGGIAGVLSGGSIDNAVMSQSFGAVAVSNTSQVVNYVGGIVGVVANAGNRVSTITNTIVNADVTGSYIVGGAIGQIANATMVNALAVKDNTITLTGERADPYLGGIVGYISPDNNSSLTMTNSYSTSSLVLHTTTSGLASLASIGGLIGGAGRVPELAYCYTTSTIDATVEDLRSLDTTADFTQCFENPNVDVSFEYSINPNYTSPVPYNNVYYLGHNTTSNNMITQLQSYNLSTNYGISFRAKAYRADIGLRVNNYGQSSLTYGQNFITSTSEDIVIGTSEDTFYNLFGSVYQIPYAKAESDILEPEDIIYNHLRDSFMLDSYTELAYNQENGEYSNSTPLTNYVTDTRVVVEDGTIYQVDEGNNKLVDSVSGDYITIAPTVCSATRQTVYMKDNGENYIYQTGLNSGFVCQNDVTISANGNATIGRYYTSLPDGNYTIRTTTHNSGTYGVTTVYQADRTAYQYVIVGNIYGYRIGNGPSFVFDILGSSDNVNVVRTLAEVDTLQLRTSYTDGNGNYYEHTYVQMNDDFIESYINLVTQDVYAFNEANGNFVILNVNNDSYSFGSITLAVPEIPVWNVSTTGLSTLQFENNLDWTR